MKYYKFMMDDTYFHNADITLLQGELFTKKELVKRRIPILPKYFQEVELSPKQTLTSFGVRREWRR